MGRAAVGLTSRRRLTVVGAATDLRAFPNSGRRQRHYGSIGSIVTSASSATPRVLIEMGLPSVRSVAGCANAKSLARS
jgi:hypothetical protein